MSFNNEGKKAFVAAEALGKKLLVKLGSAGTVSVNDATATNVVVGVNDYGVAAAEDANIQMMNRPGSLEVMAGGAFSIADPLYAAAAGKVVGLPTAAGTYRQVGWALQASGGDGEIVEMMPVNGVITATVSE